MLALALPFTSWAQGEVQFNRSQSAIQIDRVFVLAGESNPCHGVEIDAQAVAEYAEVRLLSQYEILERKHLEMILKEQSLGMSGLVFEDQAVEAGDGFSPSPSHVLVSTNLFIIKSFSNILKYHNLINVT